MNQTEMYRPFVVPIAHPASESLLAGWQLYLALGREFASEPLGGSEERLAHIVFAEFVRCSRLYRCVLSLVADGFGPEAESLTRGMYDATLDAFWAMSHPTDAVQRFDLHIDYMYHLNQEARTKSGKFPNDEPLVPMSPDDRAKATQLFGKYGELPWTGQKIRERHQTFVGSFDQTSFARDSVQGCFSLIRPWLNWSVHGSPINLFRGTVVNETQRIFRVGPDTVDIDDALTFSADQMMYNMGALLTYLGREPSRDLKSALFRVWCAFHKGAHSAGRNDPCPCGSGKKYKFCHLP